MNEIVQHENDPNIMEIEGHGRVEYMEFENDLWVTDFFAEKKGSGARLIFAFRKYAKKVNKNIYGSLEIQPHHTQMSIERLKRCYHLLGGVPVKMKGHPHAMRLEVR